MKNQVKYFIVLLAMLCLCSCSRSTTGGCYDFSRGSVHMKSSYSSNGNRSRGNPSQANMFSFKRLKKNGLHRAPKRR